MQPKHHYPHMYRPALIAPNDDRKDHVHHGMVQNLLDASSYIGQPEKIIFYNYNIDKDYY